MSSWPLPRKKKQPSNISASVNIETIIHIKTAKLNALMYIIIETNKHCSLVVNYEHDSKKYTC